MVQVDTQAFLDDLYALRQIGAFKTGVSRPTYSAADMESRHWLVDRMAEVGLAGSIDGIGNVFGKTSRPGPIALVGSHIESQIEAGWLDGALGVVAGLALARSGLAVDVCAFADEESHFEGGYIGSRSIVGDLSEAQMDASRSRDRQQTLRDALASAGLAGRERVQIDPARYRGFFEMHIEQGSQLEKDALKIGVVSGIVGIWAWSIVVEGQQDHAGGTTMAERRDAGLSAVRLLAALDEVFPKVCGPRSTWTTCNVTFEPGAPVGIIPGRAEIRLEFRDQSMAVLERMEAALAAVVQESNRRERTKATLQSVNKSMPVICDSEMIAALAKAAQHHAGTEWQHMPSGAGHDAKMIAKKLPVSMLFVPSIGGVSHHWTEDTSDEDLALGIQVLASAVETYLAGR
ncbi:Zn-dependent hydrolase [Devosia naphthalenivorans]|uniref:Zn-dependent hydrolase n=1 Tax=Devosia naphthalenivorans TaxID=2082392 RepID=UPI000D3A6601|nr:Zn-dependent hydrolase [Devosia naphthalenivorans]